MPTAKPKKPAPKAKPQKPKPAKAKPVKAKPVKPKPVKPKKKPNVDQQEINQFSQFSPTWWDKEGKFKTLHEINPARLRYVESKIDLKDKALLDIGCGGGIFTESAASSKAQTTGIDLSEDLIEIAKLHLYESNLQVDYQCIAAEDFADKNAGKFDVVTCFEMLEHVPDPKSIVQACAKLTKPGGHLFFSTINRNLKAWALAIIGAEYIFKIIPQGSHHYEKLIRPRELHQWCREANINVLDKKGIHYNPMTSRFRVHKNLDINYIIHAQKPE